MENKTPEKNHHKLHLDRPMIMKLVGIVICVALLVIIPIGATSERTKFLTHAHERSDTIVTLEPGCETAGAAYKHCLYEGCTYTEDVEVLALDHQVEGLVCVRCEKQFEPEFQMVDGILVVFVYGNQVDDYTGLVNYEGDKLYAIDGVWQSEFNGLHEVDGALYYIEDGKVRLDYNGYYYGSRKYYVKEGVAYTYYCGKVDFTWPLPGGGYITSYFGYRDRPIEGATTDHNAVDIGIGSGSTIVSVADGTVVSVGYNSGRGNYIIVQHDDGLKTLYQHCSTIDANTGDYVSMGEKIATVGSTGVSTGPHLHIEVYLNGTPVDPLFYISN